MLRKMACANEYMLGKIMMKVVGIDPAPTKGLHVFDGQEHQHILLPNARAYINALHNQHDLLVCWDSPLTGPPTNIVNGEEADGSDFSQRLIESFFSRKESEFKVPKGISVRGYSGCPHWALSRSLLGFPRVGPFDAIELSLPFKLLTTDTPPMDGCHMVEVHPAVALWLWTRDKRESNADWNYKESGQVMGELWNILLQVPRISDALGMAHHDVPSSDDKLDAIVAYLLGRLWVSSPRTVVLLGDSNHGTFLLPHVDGLEDAWAYFMNEFA